MRLQDLTLEQEIILIGGGGLLMFVAFIGFILAHDAYMYYKGKEERLRRLDRK